MDAPAMAQAKAAILMLQSLILALTEQGLLSGEDVLSALEVVIEAHRSAAAGHDAAFHDSVVRVLATATEEVTNF